MQEVYKPFCLPSLSPLQGTAALRQLMDTQQAWPLQKGGVLLPMHPCQLPQVTPRY